MVQLVSILLVFTEIFLLREVFESYEDIVDIKNGRPVVVPPPVLPPVIPPPLEPPVTPPVIPPPVCQKVIGGTLHTFEVGSSDMPVNGQTYIYNTSDGWKFWCTPHMLHSTDIYPYYWHICFYNPEHGGCNEDYQGRTGNGYFEYSNERSVYQNRKLGINFPKTNQKGEDPSFC